MKLSNQKLTGWIAAAILLLSRKLMRQDPPRPHPRVRSRASRSTAPIYDFGTMLEGAPVKHEFTIKNVGQADLVIGQVQTSCGCTVAQSEKKRLAPGEQTQLPVTFDTRHETGPRDPRIDVYTNDPQTPDLVLTIQGTVRRESEATPPEVLFDSVRKGSEQTREVTISYNGTTKDFSITKVANSNPNIAVTQEPGLKLKVALLKTMPSGPFQDTIEIATTGPPDRNPDLRQDRR